jgi:hypothetical protein
MENPASNTYLLPMWSVYQDDDELVRSAVQIVHGDALDCRHLPPDEECDESGIMYTSWFPSSGQSHDLQCARHWYDDHARCGGKYRIEDMAREEYVKQCEEFENYRRRMVKEANSQIHEAAIRLSDLGFREDAHEIFRTTDRLMIITSGLPNC